MVQTRSCAFPLLDEEKENKGQSKGIIMNIKYILGRINRNAKVVLFNNSMSWYQNFTHVIFDFLIYLKGLTFKSSINATMSVDAAKKLKKDGFVVFNLYEEDDYFSAISEEVANTFSTMRSVNIDLHDLGLDRMVDCMVKHPDLIKILDYPSVVDTLKLYFKSNFRVFSADVFRTHSADPTSSKSLQSLRYHRDNIPRSGVKVFVYLTNVTKETGAITLSPKIVARELEKKGVYLREEIEEHFDLVDKSATVVEGKRGCIILFTPQSVIHRAVLPLKNYRDVVSFTVHPTLKSEVAYDAQELEKISNNQGYLIDPFRFKPLRTGEQ